MVADCQKSREDFKEMKLDGLTDGKHLKDLELFNQLVENSMVVTIL